ncbi:hypothetical protein BJ964_004195 [Actinoplanes lobatus]|uniref:Uncharacterized protein n=1 Tax=Actinoplanes lobatus TaxID=113568 RepID=A0A7W7MH34_9ACTN|nr:hypothetical protein [Actinoplanes lobatus]
MACCSVGGRPGGRELVASLDLVGLAGVSLAVVEVAWRAGEPAALAGCLRDDAAGHGEHVALGQPDRVPLRHQDDEGVVDDVIAASAPGAAAVAEGAGPSGRGGVGGVAGSARAGKSQLAAGYARWCLAHGFDLVAWINAESGPVPELAELAAHLGPPGWRRWSRSRPRRQRCADGWNVTGVPGGCGSGTAWPGSAGCRAGWRFGHRGRQDRKVFRSSPAPSAVNASVKSSSA